MSPTPHYGYGSYGCQVPQGGDKFLRGAHYFGAGADHGPRDSEVPMPFNFGYGKQAFSPASVAEVHQILQQHLDKLQQSQKPAPDLQLMGQDQAWGQEQHEEKAKGGSRGQDVLMLRGLPFEMSAAEVEDFVKATGCAKFLARCARPVKLLSNSDGKPSGYAKIHLRNSTCFGQVRGLLHMQYLGQRYVEVLPPRHESRQDQRNARDRHRGKEQKASKAVRGDQFMDGFVRLAL